MSIARHAFHERGIRGPPSVYSLAFCLKIHDRIFPMVAKNASRMSEAKLCQNV